MAVLGLVLFGAGCREARCTEPTDAGCIRAVYAGAPGDYAELADIPASALLAPDAEGRYDIRSGQQITVVTAAQLPADATRFLLQRSPPRSLPGQPEPLSFEQMVSPVGTTYTFTATEDDAASTLITFDLTAARPNPVRPTHKPELGDVVVTTVFSVETTSPRYNAYDTTGEVTEAGSYAFLSDAADTTSAVTTYEGLRDGTTTALLIHTSDAYGASQAALYDTVAAGDLVEWHEADDCFVRYRVTEVKPDPTGVMPRKLLAVEWMTYAFTGCSGAVSANAVATVDWGDLPDLGGAGLTAPVVHGIYQLLPAGWTGAIQEPELHLSATTSYGNPIGTENIADARTLPYWRDPEVPAGWAFGWASSGGLSDPDYGYCATYLTEPRPSPLHGGELRRIRGVEVCGYHAGARLDAELASWANGSAAGKSGWMQQRTGPGTIERFGQVALVLAVAAAEAHPRHGGGSPSLRATSASRTGSGRLSQGGSS